MRTILCGLALVVAAGFCSARAKIEQDKAKAKVDAERVKGMKAAVADIEKGVLKLIEPPLPAPAWYAEYRKLLKKECGVETTIEGFEDDPSGGRKGAAGYNDVMRVEIEHRFGVGILGRLQKRAEEITEGMGGKPKDGKKEEKNDGLPFGLEVFVHPVLKLPAK
jgi:hypothetical protein